MGMKFLRVILNKTKKTGYEILTIRLELGVDEIKNEIEKVRLRWFGHVMRMREVRI